MRPSSLAAALTLAVVLPGVPSHRSAVLAHPAEPRAPLLTALTAPGRSGFGPAAAEISGRRFVVVWAELAVDFEPGVILGRLLDTDGRLLGPPFRVSETPIAGFGPSGLPVAAVTPLADGGFFAAWRWDAGSGDGEILGRRFTAAASPIGGEIQISRGDEFQINADSRGDQRGPAAAGLANGGVVVVWETAAGDAVRLHARLFDAETQPRTADFPVSEEEADHDQRSAWVVPHPGGGFSIGWTVDEETDRRLRRQRSFDALAAPLGPPSRSLAGASERACGVSAWGLSGARLWVWPGECGEPSPIVAAVVGPVFADGFEGGDTSAWSDRVPRMTLDFLSPEPGVCTAMATPPVALSYVSPTGQGVNPATVVLTANGTPVSSSCTADASTIDCVLNGPLPEGVVDLVAMAEDTEGHAAAPDSVTFTVDTLAPDPVDTVRVTLTPNGSGQVSVAGGPDAAEPQAQVTVTNQTTPASVNVTADFDGSFLAVLAAVEGDVLALSQTDCGGNTSGDALLTVPGGGQNLPPDPIDVAPPVDPTEPTDFHEATEFLYTGPNPIQTGVLPGVIEPGRVAVLRGRVLAHGGAPLPGARVTYLGHTEFGETLSRADGVFDLAVNGGGEVVLVYEKTGYLPVQRRLDAPWRDFAWAPDVVLAELDPLVTTIEAGAATMQVAQGSEVTDPHGTRCPTVLVPAGTQAEMVLPDGTTLPLASLDFRATEFTVGESGPAAMPAPLPGNTGYTYALELSADEAIAAGAVAVEFDQVLVQYVENFLDFPVGGEVPLGYYDRLEAAWLPSDNGRTVEVLGVDPQGRAELDIDGSGQPADATALAELGVSDDERFEVAALYTPGTELWRLPIQHFTPWDLNWPYGPPPDAEEPPDPSTKPEDTNPNDDDDEPATDLDDPCPKSGGSFVDCENQALRESLPIVGTPFSLNYSSARVPGRRIKNTLHIPLSGGSIPASVEQIEVEIRVAGRRFIQQLAPTPNLSYRFTWDGLDSYGRAIAGGVTATVETRYVYDAVYYEPSNLAQAFGTWSDTTEVIGIQGRGEIVLSRTGELPLLASDSHHQVLNGWTLDVHNEYEPSMRRLSLGTGEIRGAAELELGIATAAGVGTPGFGGNGGPATEAELNFPYRVRRGSDGSLYIPEPGNHVVRRIRPDGIIEVFAGNGTQGYSGDGGPAVAAQLSVPVDMAIAPDGSAFIADEIGVIRRVDTAGIISTVFVVPPGTPGPRGLAVSSNGRLFMVNLLTQRVFRIEPDGTFVSFGGSGAGDGLPASQTAFSFPFDLEFGPDGTLYVVESGSRKVRAIGRDGIVRTVAGNSQADPGTGDGGPATEAGLGSVNSIAIGPDGTLYIPHGNGSRVRAVSPGGIITTIAGNGVDGYTGDGGPATAASLLGPTGIEIDQDGRVLIADPDAHVIRAVSPLLPGFNPTDFVLPSRDGRQLFAMSMAGRHLSTVDAHTGSEVWTFGYDGEGRLTSVEDAFSNVTVIERDPKGDPVAIIGPFGHRTDLGLGTDGYLASITTPEGVVTQFTYYEGGLLKTMIDPRGGVHSTAVPQSPLRKA